MAVLLRCLLNANLVDSTYEGHTIPKGSFVTSIAVLSHQTGVKENSVRSSLKHLQTSNIISIESTNRYTIITIIDTDVYAGSLKTEINSTYKQDSIQPTIEEELRIKEVEKKKEDTKVSSKKEKFFVKPTVEEVREYCSQRSNHVDADKFWNYYESNGWKVGKNPMKAVRTWERSDTDVAKEASQLSVNFGERTYVERKEDYWQQ